MKNVDCVDAQCEKISSKSAEKIIGRNRVERKVPFYRAVSYHAGNAEWFSEFVHRGSEKEHKEIVHRSMFGLTNKDILKTKIRIHNIDVRRIMRFGLEIKTVPSEVEENRYHHLVRTVEQSNHYLAYQLKLKKYDEILWFNICGTVDHLKHNQMVDFLQEELPLMENFVMVVRRMHFTRLPTRRKYDYLKMTVRLNWKDGRLIAAINIVELNTDLLVIPPRQKITDLEAKTTSHSVHVNSAQDMRSFWTVDQQTGQLICGIEPTTFNIQLYSGNNNTQQLAPGQSTVFIIIFEDLAQQKVVIGDRNSVLAMQQPSINVTINTHTTETLQHQKWHFLLTHVDAELITLESLDAPGFYLTRSKDNKLVLRFCQNPTRVKAAQFQFWNPRTGTGIKTQKIYQRRPSSSCNGQHNEDDSDSDCDSDSTCSIESISSGISHTHLLKCCLGSVRR